MDIRQQPASPVSAAGPCHAVHACCQDYDRLHQTKATKWMGIIFHMHEWQRRLRAYKLSGAYLDSGVRCSALSCWPTGGARRSATDSPTEGCRLAALAALAPAAAQAAAAAMAGAFATRAAVMQTGQTINQAGSR